MNDCANVTYTRSPPQAGRSAQAEVVGTWEVVVGDDLLEEIVQHGATGADWIAIVAGFISMLCAQHGWLVAVAVQARHKDGNTPEESTSKATANLSQRCIDSS